MKPKNRSEMLSLIKSSIGGVVKAVEIGVLRGAFSEMILERMEPEELHLVVTWGTHLETFADYKDYNNDKWSRMYQSVKDRFSAFGNVSIHRALSTDAAKMFKPESFDFIYIDADHDRLEEDLSAWYPLLKSGCWIAGHDYNLKAIKRDVVKFFGTDFLTTGETSIPSWFHQKK